MDGTALMIFIILNLLAAACGLVWLILFITGCVKKSKKRILMSFIPLGAFAVIAGGIFAYDAVKIYRFEKIPLLEINNDTVTILSSTSSGSFGSNYVLAEEDEKGSIAVRNKGEKIREGMGNVFMTSDDSILTETDQPSYLNHRKNKSGYTFKVNKPGTAYVCIFIREMEHFSYLDIYKVISDDNMTVTADNIKHIKCDDKFKDELPAEFSFLTEVYDELN